MLKTRQAPTSKDLALRPGPKLVLALLTIAAAAIYAALHLDPYIGLLMLPFFALGCGRGKHPAVLIALSALPALLLVAASHVKFYLTGIPLVTYDQHFLGRNVLMMIYNDWRIATAVIGTIVLVALYAYALLSGRAAYSRFEKWGAASLAVVAAGCILTLSTSNKTEKIDAWETQLSTPTVKTFVASASMPGPKLHVIPQAQAAIPPTTQAADVPKLGAPAGGLPDIFFVLQETTFHPKLTIRPGYKTKALFADDLPHTAGHTGPLHVHTFAGATWKSEFSVTTQMRPQEFGNDGLYVFYQLKGRIKESVFTRLKALGYRTMVFYPVPGHFIDARDFYTSIGVEEFYDPKALGLSAGWDFKMSDAMVYDAMLKKIAGSDDDRPVAAMVLTINQHGPHDGQDAISDYMYRFEQSDEAYGGFLTALEQRGRKAGVVTFGDHQPDFMATRHVRELWYYTYYDIRCVNFPCVDRAITIHDDKQLDIVMLTPRALEAFGFQLDSFSALENTLFKDCDHDLSHCSDEARLGVNTAFSKFFE